jgi:hypothetical protein
MNLGRIYDIVLAVLKKEGRGNTVSPERFTYFLQQCHLEYYNQQYSKWAATQNIQDSLRPFLISDETVAFTGTTKALSTLRSGVGQGNYMHAVSARYSTGDYKFDILTPEEWNEWASDALMKATAIYPLMMIDGTNINILPTLTGNIKFSYLIQCEQDVSPYDSSDNIDSGTTTSTSANKLVQTGQNFLTTVSVGMIVRNTTDGTEASVTAVDSDTTLSLSSDIMTSGEKYVIYTHLMGSNKFYLPFFDYYLDANYNVKYLYNGQTYTLTTGEVYRDGTASGAVTGVSHELKWGDQDVVNIISLLIEKISISMQSPDVTQYAMALEQKQNII